MNNQHLIPARKDVYINAVDSYTSSFQINQKVDLLTTEQLYEAVFENAFHPMYISSNDGKILRFNEKLWRLFGYKEKEMAENNSSDLFDNEDNAFICFLEERKRIGIAKAEILGIKKSGLTFPCRISSVIYQTDDGLKRSLNTIVDISKNLAARWCIAG